MEPSSRSTAEAEQTAVTGGVPAAAEPPPTTRDRRSAFAAFAWVLALAGVMLAVTGLLADQSSEAALGTVLAGVALAVLGVLMMVGVIGTRLGAAIAIAAGGLLVAVVFTDPRTTIVDAVLLGSAAAAVLGGFASLASSRRYAASEDEEEPRPGIESR